MTMTFHCKVMLTMTTTSTTNNNDWFTEGAAEEMTNDHGVEHATVLDNNHVDDDVDDDDGHKGSQCKQLLSAEWVYLLACTQAAAPRTERCLLDTELCHRELIMHKDKARE